MLELKENYNNFVPCLFSFFSSFMTSKIKDCTTLLCFFLSRIEQALSQSSAVKQKEFFVMFSKLFTGRHTSGSLLPEKELGVMILFFAVVSFSLFRSYKKVA